MSDRRVLLISQVFYPDEVAVANLFTILMSELVKLGFELEVWCAQPSYTTSDKQPGIRVNNGIKIHYLKSTQFHKDKLYGRFLNFTTFTISTVVKLIFSKSKTKVISHTTPPFLAILLAFICSVKKRDFYYVLMDVFPDGLVRLEKISDRNIFIRMWSSFHLSALKRCKKIVVIGRDMGEWLINIYPNGADKIEYIPLWQDPDLIEPIDFGKNSFVLANNLNNDFVVQYSGNMGLWNEMGVIGDAVNKKPDGVIFCFIGGGMRKNELLGSLNGNASENVRFFPFQSNENYSLSVSACHVALVTLRKGAEGMAVPSKIIGIMAAGIPVLALVPERSEIAYIITEEQCGFVLNPSDSEGLIEAIIHLKNDEGLRKKMGKNGRDAFLKKYTSKIIAERYSELLST
jgi:colanic acid biosynthesis glycosyl transferase WcaI